MIEVFFEQADDFFFFKRKKKVSLHLIQRRRNIPHQTHQQKRNLQNRIGDKIQPADERFTPCVGLKVDEK